MTDATRENTAAASASAPDHGAVDHGAVDHSAIDHSAIDHSARDRLVLVLLIASTFVVFLNETIMSVALPSIGEDLGIQPSTAQWLTTGFLLTSSVVIPITGWLLQRLPTRTIFILAMSLFTAGTIVAASAPNFAVLLTGRVVQASGTAIMLPLLFTTALTLIDEQHRGRIMGNISIVISVAPAIGPTIGGVILQHFPWRMMFVFVLPLAIAALIIGTLKVPNVTETRRTPLDIPSIVLSALAFGGLVYGLNQISQAVSGAESVWLVIAPLIVGVAALAVFIARQFRLQRDDRALLDLRTFRSPVFRVAMIMAVVSMMALFGSVNVLPYYMGYVLHLGTQAIGLSLLPGGLIMGLLSPLVGRLFDRFGPRILVIVGAVLVSASLWGMAMLLGVGTPLGVLIGLHIGLSVGLAFMFTPLFTSGLGSVPPHLYSHGSAILGTIQQVAGAAGVAVFITVFASLAGGAVAAQSPDPAAYAPGVHGAFLIGAVLTLVSIPLAFLIRRPAPSPDGAPVVAH